ncbi:DUF2398 family protein [Nonomuraea sp. B19D2]|uniref:DUF2398 family protein n=1 Tax=Nonomuraea sp. B19D2 TaxID=3159561 RepID=UPI0032DB84F8
MTTAAHDADERRMAARALLANPVLTAYRHGEQLPLVRRHAATLKPAFGRLLGYALVVESGFARLIKAPLSPEAPVRPARRSSGSEFTPRTYTYLALVCAGLLTRDVGEQVLLSQLVEQIRADAVTAGGLLPHLIARPLHPLDRPDLLWAADPDEPEQPRRTLRRKLVENPLVHRGDLSDAERDLLRRERTELTRILEEGFGLTLEVRTEGALAYDADAQLTDVVLPGTGTVRQAALLLIDALIQALQPSTGTEVTLDGRTVPGVLPRGTSSTTNSASSRKPIPASGGRTSSTIHSSSGTPCRSRQAAAPDRPGGPQKGGGGIPIAASLNSLHPDCPGHDDSAESGGWMPRLRPRLSR